jgi:tetratricopeptide (TPR) repeat protein
MRAYKASTPLHVLFIILLGLVAYSNTFDVPFHWDSGTFIEKNPFVKNIDLLHAPPEGEGKLHAATKRRYVGYLTFALNHRAHGAEVPGYHVVNTAIHLLNALLLYLLVVLAFRTPFLRRSTLAEDARHVALLAGLLFVSHPVQTEAVTYIFQRLASLAALFCLLSISAYVGSRLQAGKIRRYFLYALSLISSVLAMKTKENAFTLPATLAAVEFLFFSGMVKDRLLRLAPFVLTMLIVPFGLTELHTVEGGIIGGALSAIKSHRGVSPLEYLFTQSRVTATYLRLLFLPVGQNIDYDYPVLRSFFTPQVLLPSILLLGLFTSGVLLVLRSRVSDPALRLAGFGIFWFFIAMSVESSVIPLPMVINEYRLYLPSAGLFIAAASGVFLMLGKTGGRLPGRAATALFIIAPLVLAGATYKRNAYWGTTTSLWEDVVKKSPGKARAYHNLGVTYRESGDSEKATAYFLTAIRLRPESPTAHFSLAQIYEEKGTAKEAITHYERAVELNPELAEAHNNLGVLYNAEGLTGRAIEHFEAAVRLKPGYVAAHNNLGLMYRKTGRMDKALEHLQKALGLNPDNPETHSHIGVFYASTKRYTKAIEHFRTAIRLDPDNEKYFNNLGIVYARMGIMEMATAQFREALRINPGYETARRNLEVILEK